MFGALEALIGVHKPNYFTDSLRNIVRMCEQCVPGRIFRPGNEAMELGIREDHVREGSPPSWAYS